MSERPATKADLETLGEAMKVDAAGLRKELETKATKVDLAALGEAMKADVAGLRAEFTGLREELETKVTKTELSNLREEMKSEFKSVRAEMSTKTELSEARRELALAILDTNKRIDYLEGSLRTEMREGTSRVLQAIDAFTGKAQNSERAAVLHGQALTDVQVGMKDHERRITTLEAR
ncbi:MAG TPA: hypothetical protein DCZ01_09705 [Elusimicrobia bacterium]|nr:hypothetical protein [Elusimicrobiota bacterium]